jgi:hypothetical protein
MSHHFDSPAALTDGRINPCDLYVFPAAAGTTALILTVNPDAGRSSPATFRPGALYELVVASNAGISEDITFRITFTEPDDHGRQQVQIRRADGPAARHGSEGILLGEGRTGAVFSLAEDGLAWAGLAADPFTGDGVALGGFLRGLSEGRYTPEVFTAAPSNLFAGRDVTGIALQLPDTGLGRSRIALWGRISLNGHARQRQVSRIGQPMLRPLFFNPPDTEVDALNAGTPAPTEPATASGSTAWPRPWPVSPACRILTATPSGWRWRFFLTCSASGPASRRPSTPATATGGRWATTPSTSPWPSWSGRHSHPPPPHARPPQPSPIFPHRNRLRCPPSSTSISTSRKAQADEDRPWVAAAGRP